MPKALRTPWNNVLKNIHTIYAGHQFGQYSTYKNLEHVMKDIKASRVISKVRKSNHDTQQVCNYDNDYYGDQVCILANKAGK